MAKINSIQTSFSTGEISERSKGRVDLKEYYNACDMLENFLPLPQGGVTKKPGSKYFPVTLLSAGFSPERIFPFIYDKDTSYKVVLSNSLVVGRNIRIFNSSGQEQLNIATDVLWASSTDLNGFSYTQNGDIMVIVHKSGSIPPVYVIRGGAEDLKYTFSVLQPNIISTAGINTFMPKTARFSPAVFVPYLDENINIDILMYVNTTTIGTNRTLFVTDGTNSVPFFESSHIGAYFKIDDGSQTGVVKVTSFTGDVSIVPADINTGTDTITAAAHGLLTGDIISMYTNGVGTPPVITGATFGAANYFRQTNSIYFFVAAPTANTLTLHPTYADAVAGTNIFNFTSAGVGMILFIDPFKIASVRITVEEPVGAGVTSAGAAVDSWSESAWSDYQGWPKTAVFHEQRLYFGGTKKRVDSIYGSQVGNIFNMMQTKLTQDSTAPTTTGTNSGLPFLLFGTAAPTDPFSFTIAAKEANEIQWMVSQRTLQVGTFGTEYVVSGYDSIVSNESINIKPQTNYGSSFVRPVSVNTSTYFVTRDGKSLREFKYNDENGSYISNKLSILADHMVYKGFGGLSTSELKGIKFTQVAYQQSRDMVWLLTSRNALISVCVSKETESNSWAYHPTRAGDTIKSICVLPNADGSYDDLVMLVDRDINNSTVTYIEKMGDDFEHTFLDNTSTEKGDHPHYTDCSIRIDLGAPGTAVSGLSHLEGETVTILADGEQVGTKVVTAGAITLDAAATIVIVGLPYTSKLRTLDLEAGGEFGGSSTGMIQRIDRVTARLYKSQGGSYGNKDQSPLYDFEYPSTEVYSGVKRLDFKISPDIENQVYIEHSDPVPFTVLSLTYRGMAHD